MRTLGKILAGICAVLFVVSGVIALVLFNIERKAFSSETFKRVFAEQGLYESAPSILASALRASAENSDDASGFETILSREDWEIVISSLLPPDELESLTNQLLDSAFDFINGKTNSITITLLPFKRHMVSDAGVQAFQQILLAQPDCTAGQLLQMAQSAISPGEGLILCNPPAEIMGMITPLIETQLQFMTISIPDDMTLVSAKRLGPERDFRPRLNRMRAFMQLTPLLPLFFLTAITVLAVRSLEEWLRWWGIPFIITGILGALIGFSGAPIIRSLIQRMILQGSADMPVVLLDVMRNVGASLVRQILQPVAVEGTIMAILGIGMTLGAACLPKKEKTKQSIVA